MPLHPTYRSAKHPSRPGVAEPSRRLTLHRLWALLSGLTIGGPSALLGGCGGGGGGGDNGGMAASPPLPALGVHGLAINTLRTSTESHFDEEMTRSRRAARFWCASAGATLTSTRRFRRTPGGQHLRQLDTKHPYTLWQGSVYALYACPSAAGGSGHIVSAANVRGKQDEITLAVVEVKNGGVIKDVQWHEVLSALPSPAGASRPQARPPWSPSGGATQTARRRMDCDTNDGFVVCDSILQQGAPGPVRGRHQGRASSGHLQRHLGRDASAGRAIVAGGGAVGVNGPLTRPDVTSLNPR